MSTLEPTESGQGEREPSAAEPPREPAPLPEAAPAVPVPDAVDPVQALEPVPPPPTPTAEQPRAPELPSPAPRPSLEASATTVSRFFEACGLLFAVGASVGLMAWTLWNWSSMQLHVQTNKLDFGDRRFMFLAMGLSGLFAPLLTWLTAFRGRRTSVASFHQTALRLLPLVVSGLVPLLFAWPLWQGRELAGLTFIACTALALERAVRTSLSLAPAPLGHARVASASWAPLVAVVLGAVGYAVFFSIYTLRNHYRFATSAYDLGIENNLVWNAAHLNGPLFKTSPLGGPDSVHSGYHQTFISYLIALPYRLWPTPQFMLVLQAVVIAAGSLPLFVWLKGRVDPWLAALVAFAYLLYPPLHGSNLYDFHYQPFGPFFLVTTLVLFERGRLGWAVVMALLTVSVREDMSLLLGVIGAFLVLTRQRVAAGLILCVVCGVIFVVQKLIIMPSFLNGFPAYVNQYQGLVAHGEPISYGNVLKTVFTNPGYTFGSIVEQAKLVYALQVFVPLVFLPLRSPLGWLLCLPGLFFTLLSTQYPPLVMISFQYTAYWSMFVFLAVGWVLFKAEPARRTSMAAALVLATLATSVNFGALFRPDGARGAYDVHRFSLTEADHRRHADVYALIEQIPADARVAASERLNPHVSSRKNAYTLRGSAFDADYLLFELAVLGPNERDAVRPLLTKNEIGVVDARGGFWLLKRGADPARNGELAPYFQ
ncbi:MAG: DUF2079 domain-containing protein [Myxococcaceae bacterium]|nr:DUF2079 domain-containing protein [Myxococcaceae bacterium]